MITSFSVSLNGVELEHSLSRCTAYEFPIDRSKMLSDGWENHEYDVVFTKNDVAVGAHQNSYFEIFSVTSTDDDGLETTKDVKIWINFIPKI